MIETIATQQPPNASRRQASRVLDTAVGILVGWRRCSTDAAFRELIGVSERHEVPIFALAAALVALASRDADRPPADAAARLAAEKEWGLTHLL
ncbi:ANTAR domain-containing protein [Mycobacterium sp. Marseille-P9652]|uniref:ANTAR domain-containing protein n=1 Tax=Mycobacterium sp. Marseille-P9652 TaxID=2654950 RepID=UPI001E56540D|nr:ANTAR domain-containing protein [Mycobacterium sp. Marseille-P9652]